MQTLVWSETGWAARLERWIAGAAEPGVLRVVFAEPGGGEAPDRALLERWIRTRAVTVAEIRADLSPPALDLALCCDLVYIEADRTLDGGAGEPSPGVVWALGRAGRVALARGLLDPTPIAAAEAVDLGLAQGVLTAGEDAPPARGGSLTALTTARDLMRAGARGRPAAALELAAFRLLFAAGDPNEGAGAFIERREPIFERARDGRSGEESTR